MVVTIDGPAGAGKSTVAKIIGKKTNLKHINSGTLYRVITFGLYAQFRENLMHVLETEPESLSAAVQEFSLDVSGNTILLNEKEIQEKDIRSEVVDAHVSPISTVPELRNWVNRVLLDISQNQDIIVEGRDMSTVVFPDADIKIYLDADIETRAQRRYEQTNHNQHIDDIRENIRTRDRIDREKPVGSLICAPDAQYLDTSDLTIMQVCEIVTGLIDEYERGRRRQLVMADKEQQNPDSKTLFQKELQEEYLKSLDELEVGQLIDGTVVAVTKEQVFIDVGYKSEGKISINQFEDPPAEGDSIQVVLINKEGRNGEVIVSKQKADERIIWKKIKTAYQDGSAIEGSVSRIVKGGFEILLGGGNHGFNPISKMDLFKIDNQEKYIGTKSLFHIERLYSDNRVNIILSRRKWLEKEVDRKRSEFFEKADEGDIVEGTVKSFTSFGAFIDLGGFDGLLHINDMGWGHVAKPKDHVKKGELLRLKIIRLNPEDRKINLSLKDLTPNPWENFTDLFQLHDAVTGKVTKLTDFGAFVELENGIEGLVHISELSWTKRIKHPREMLEVGEEVTVRILGFDLDAQKVSLGIKQNLPNPWDEIENNYPEGTKLKRVVKKITATGAFVELEESIDGFLHRDDLSWTRRHKNLNAILKVGEEIEVIVLESSVEKHNIRLGVKQMESDPWQELSSSYSSGSIIQAEVTKVAEFGIFAQVAGGIEGLIPKVHLGDPREVNLEEELGKYKVGQNITVSILELDAEKQKLSFSIRDMNKTQERQEIEKYIADSTDSESSATMADFLKSDN